MLKNLKQIPCCVTPQQHAALRALSKRSGVSIQDYMREAVADVLGKHDGSTPPTGKSGYITDHDLAAAQKVFDMNSDPIWGSCNGQIDALKRAEFKRAFAAFIDPARLLAARNDPGMTPECARAYAIFSRLQAAWAAGVKWATEQGACATAPASKSSRAKAKAGYITEPPKIEEVREKDRDRFNRLLEKAKEEQSTALRARFYQVLEAEIAKRLPLEAQQEIERARRQVASAKDLELIWRHRTARAVEAMRLFIDNWRTLIGCLHPDRADHSSDDDRRQRMSKATDIVTRTKDLILETGYKKW